MKEAIERLISHMIWADERLASLLEGEPAVSSEILGLLAHVAAAEHIWLSRLRGEDRTEVKVWPDLPVEASLAMLRQNASAYRAYVADASDADLSSTISYKNSAGRLFNTIKGDVLLHVATHGAYHRGQIAKLFRQEGGQPVNTDYIAFVREVD